MTLPITSAQYVRRALLKIDGATLLAAVDTLDLRGNAKLSAVIAMPLRSLQQRRDVAAFATSAPIAAAKGLLELIAMDPLERVVAALGDHADSPSFEQLSAAVDVELARGSTVDEVVALLAFAIGEEFPAAAHCRRLLDERTEFALPALPALPDVVPGLLTPKQVDPEVRAQRRARREEEKRKRRNSAPVHPAHPVRAKSEKTMAPRSASASAPAPVPEVGRRRVPLTPGELERFRSDHPFVASVVLVEVPYDSVDRTAPDQHAKSRPALVVAAGDGAILVRAIYSNPSRRRVLFQPWRRLGLDHVSYIDDERTVLALADLDNVERLGRLSDDEWNTLW